MPARAFRSPAGIGNAPFRYKRSQNSLEGENRTGFLQRHQVPGRALDNVMVERLWRTVKYEDIYLRDDADGGELRSGLTRYFRFYNTQRPHQALGRQTPAEVHFG